MTSAIATASFLSSQCSSGRVYVIAETASSQALYNVRFSIDDSDPDYVVVGRTKSYN